MRLNTGHAVLGWIVWQVGSRLVKRRLAANRGKLVAATALVLGLAAWLAAAAGEAGED